MKRKLPIIIFIKLLLTYSSLSGQNWSKVDILTSEGFAILKQQYETDYSLPIDERLEFHKTGVAAARHQKDSLWIRQFAYYAASSAGALDSLGTALEYINIARAVAEERDPFTVNIISYQGVIHKQAGDYTQALAYYEEALQLAEKNFPDKVVLPLGNIASLYRSQKNYEKAIEYIHRSKQLSLTLDSPSKEYYLVYEYAELCIAHKHLGNLDSANYYGQLSLLNLDQIDKELNMKATAFAYITVAELLTEDLQQPDRAKPLLDSALLYTEGAYTTKVKVSLGKYYLAKKDYAAAAAVIQELQETEIQAQTTQLRVLELSLQYYTAIDEFEKALAISFNIDELKAVRFSKEKAHLTTLFSAKFEHKKKEEQLLALQYQQKETRLKYQTRSLLLLLVILLVFGVALYLKQQVSRKKKFAEILQREVNVKTTELKIANAALADKVEKLNTFNYTVSHDLKAPLISAFNFVDLIKLQSWHLLNKDNQLLIDNLYGVLTQMKEMVNGVALYLKADKSDLLPKMVETEDIVNATLKQLKHQYSTQLNPAIFTIHSPLPSCYVDPLMFRQILTNLLSNAIKATMSAEQPKIQISGQKTDQGAVITIKDNGMGIPVEHKERIFDPFKSVHSREKFPGTGVGLTIVKRIVERHGGTLSVTSKGVDRGTIVSIHLPSLH